MATAERLNPLPSYRFQVEIDGIRRAGFQQVTGLEITVEPVEHNEGGRTTPLKVPGLTRYSDITLRYGVIRDPELYRWIRDVVDRRIERRNGSIVLLDVAGEEEAVRWNFFEAWPTKLTVGDLNAETSDVLVDTLVLAIERLEQA